MLIILVRIMNGNKMVNKKASMMVALLTSLLIAFIIFAPACYVGDRLLRTSAQAKVNYGEFMGAVDKFAKNAKIGARKSTILIMDQATALVYFQKGKKDVNVEVDRTGNINYDIIFKRPDKCDNNNNCLCLFRKSEFEHGLLKVTIKPKRAICYTLDYKLRLESCSLGKAIGVNSYKCSNGFVIERNMASEGFSKGAPKAVYYENPRRRLFEFKKFKDQVLLIGK